MKLVIVGAGIGGLSAALAIRARLGAAAEILVLERTEKLEEAGAGLQLSPNATRVLFGLGLGEALTAVASAPARIEMRTAAGARLLYANELGPAAAARWGAPYLHIHRADLRTVLLDGVKAAGGIEVRTGASVGAVSQDGAGATLLLEDGALVTADAVVGADGLRSAVRAALFGAGQPRYSGQAAWRALVPAERLPDELPSPEAGVWTGLGRHFVHYPLRGGSLINLVAVADAAEPGEESWRTRGDPVALAVAFAGWPSPVAELILAADEVWRWPIYDRPPLPRWSAGRVTLLGDAAHPMPPYMAQGAAQAIEDAQALAIRLGEAGDVVRAFRRYEADRTDRTARVQAASRRNATLFHLPAFASRPMFAAAGALGLDSLDWLYGGGPA